MLWGELLKRGIKIQFAHLSFPWTGEANVHVVIIGFGFAIHSNKMIYDISDIGVVLKTPTKNISPYLVEGNDFVITNRSKPLSDVPRMVMGNQPIDDQKYLFTPDEKVAFVELESASEPFFKRWLGGKEFLNGIERWYLFLSKC